MAIEWFRSFHGAPTDPKWLVIARKANTQPGVVASIWWALMDYASQNDPRGCVAGFDGEATAAFFGYDDDTVAAVLQVLRDRRMIDEHSQLTAWNRRQPKREDDSSTERVRQYRERKKGAGNANETQVKRDVTLDESRVEKIGEQQNSDSNESGAVAPRSFPQNASRGRARPPRTAIEPQTVEQLMPLVRKHLYKHGRPPARRTEDQDFNTIQTLLDHSIPPAEIATAIEAAAAMRDDGQCVTLAAPDQSISMGILYAKPKNEGGSWRRPFWNQCIEYFNAKLERENRSGGNGLAAMGSVLSSLTPTGIAS